MTGVFTVWLIETLCRKNLMAPDAAIGIIFPLLFSIAVILITRYASHVHIDADCIIEGELAFAPFDRLVIDGVDYGAKGLYTGGGMFLFTASVIALFYKEFALSSFDPIFAEIAGFSPMTIHYGLMSLVSLVIVTAFHSVGSVLVIAFLIIPAMTASLWTRTLSSRIFLSCFIGAAGALSGIAGAIYGDTSLAGMMAAFLCLFFLISLFLSPSAGFLAAWRRRRKQKHRLLQSIDTGNGRPL